MAELSEKLGGGPEIASRRSSSRASSSSSTVLATMRSISPLGAALADELLDQ